MDSQNPETRNSLLLRLAEPADESAWQEFIQIYEPVIVRIAMRRGLQLSDAQDLCQEVLTRVAKSIGNWEPRTEKGTFRGWLSRVTRNLVIDHFRKQRRVPGSLELTVAQGLVANGDDADFEMEERRQVFRWAGDQARHHFSDSTWRAFWMTCVDCRSPAETAAFLDLSVGAVYIARSRVLARIKSIVEQSEFHPR